MAEDIRLVCPSCKTSYTTERCGIALEQWNHAAITVVCMVCGQAFNAVITPREVTEALNWWRRVVLRQTPEKYVDGHEVVTTKRELTDGAVNVGDARDTSVVSG